MRKEIKGFVFTGLLATHAVKDMQATGLLHQPEISDDERREGDLFAPVQELVRGGSLQMQHAFRVLFVLENIIRELISSRFAESDGTGWFDTRASSTMKTRCNNAKKQKRRIIGIPVATGILFSI